MNKSNHKILFLLSFFLFCIAEKDILSANDDISDKLSYKIINYGSIIMNSSSKAIFKYQDKFYVCFQSADRKNICELIKKK